MTRGFIFNSLRSKTSRSTQTHTHTNKNSHKGVSTPAYPEEPYNQIFYNPPNHIIDCKTYDKRKVTKKIVETPELLNFSRKQEMRDISRKRMLRAVEITNFLESNSETSIVPKRAFCRGAPLTWPYPWWGRASFLFLFLLPVT